MKSNPKVTTAPRHTETHLRDLGWHVAALLIPLALATIITTPVISEFSSRVVGVSSDNIAYLWAINKLAQTLTRGGSVL